MHGTLTPWKRGNRASRARAVLLLAVLLCTSANATGTDRGDASQRRVVPRELAIRWNRPLLHDLGVDIGSAADATSRPDADFESFRLLDSSSLEASTHGRSVVALIAGELRVSGGYTITTPEGSLALRDFALRLRSSMPARFDVVSSNGEILFYADNAMPESPDGKAIAISAMDLRLSPRFAAKLHRPEAASWQVGIARLREAPDQQGAAARAEEPCPSSERWPGMPVPGHPGETYRADVLMQSIWAQVTGCRDCTGPGGGGAIKLTPTSSLRNNVNAGALEETVAGDPHGTSLVRFAAEIPWREKFSRDCPPYGNAQHPFLVWNLYRWDADGSLTQIARSGVKHAHVAANAACVDHPDSNHVLARGCQDVYGPGDNDAPDTLGPRDEIVPYRGIWARCGSIFDPQCSGSPWGFRGYDDFRYRLLIPETEFAPNAHSGARYLFEAWYFARDDANPYNSVATNEIRLVWRSDYGLWASQEVRPARIGPAIDQWVSPEHPEANQLNTEVVTGDGRIKVAVRVRQLSSARYRYDYAVLNVDFASAVLEGVEPNIRLLQTHGISGFALDAPAVDGGVAEADADQAESGWKRDGVANRLRWQAPSSGEITWGTMRRFSIESDRAPARVRGWISARGMSPAAFETLGPSASR